MPDSLTALPLWWVVFLKISVTFLVIMTGWRVRRAGWLTGEDTTRLGKLVVDVTLPALVFMQMLRTVNLELMRHSWHYPLLGMGVIFLGQFIGQIFGPLFSSRSQRGTYVFCIAISNWIYLPLIIIQSIYGDKGVTALFLFNVGIQIYFWTIGLKILRAGEDGDMWRHLLLNPGLIATVSGIALALGVPSLQHLAVNDLAGASMPAQALSAVLQGLQLLGSVSVPLTFILTGSHLGALKMSRDVFSRAWVGVMVSRLLITPLAAMGILMILVKLNYTLEQLPRMLFFLIAAMPVAVSTAMIADRFGGDTDLSSAAIFYSTLCSIVTVPLMLYLYQQLPL